jgi:gas vesicle protein
MANERGKDLLVGAVVGGLLGAVTALLFAPKSGRELRADISEQAHAVSEKTQHVAEQFVDKSKQVATTVGTKTQEIAKTVSEHTTEWAGKAKETAVHLAQEVKGWKTCKQTDETSPAAATLEIVEEEK